MKRTVFKALLLYIVGMLLVAGLEVLGLFIAVDQSAYDLAMRVRGSRPPDPRVLLVAIDDATIAELGTWPIRRSHYAELLPRLEQAAAIGIDLFFLEPSDDDPLLAEAIGRSGRVVLPCFLEPGAGFRYPLAELRQAEVGHVHLEQDVDGVVRSVAGAIRRDGTVVPGFAATLVRLARGAPVLPSPSEDSATPVPDQREQVRRINYAGPAGSVPHYSMARVLAGEVPSELFAGRIVLVGMTATGTTDLFVTPFFENRRGMAGVEVQAQIVGTLLENSWIRVLGPFPTWLLALLLGAGWLVATFRRSGAWPLLFAAGAGVLVGLTSVLLLAGFELWLPPAVLAAALLVALAASYAVRLEQAHRALRQAHDDLQDLFDTFADAILIQDENGAVVRANRAGQAYVGMAQEDQLRQRCLALRARFAEQGAAGTPASGAGPTTEVFVEELYEGETQRFFEVRLLPRTGGPGQSFRGAVQVIRDCTRDKQYETEFQRLEAHLAKAQELEAIGMLVSGIAHDFNNVLSIILGNTELLLIGLPEGAPLRPRAETILEGGQRAKDLIRQILGFSKRSQRGATSQILLLGPLVKEALKLLTSALPASIQVRHQIQPHVRVRVDPIKIHQVIMNLATNAYHAMQPQGGSLTLIVDEFNPGPGHQLPPGRYARLVVADTGPGIPPEILPRIFEPHFTTKPADLGTGLGLSNVRSIIEGYRGQITVDSVVGQGATFTAYLPFEEERPRELPAQPTSALLPGVGRILLVDDEPQLVEAGRVLLEGHGYEVRPLTDSRAALQAFQDNPYGFDMAVLDLTMPGLSGTELARQLLHLRPDFPILLCTGSETRLSDEEARSLGVKGLAYKPLDGSQLLEWVAKLLSR